MLAFASVLKNSELSFSMKIKLEIRNLCSEGKPCFYLIREVQDIPKGYDVKIMADFVLCCSFSKII